MHRHIVVICQIFQFWGGIQITQFLYVYIENRHFAIDLIASGLARKFLTIDGWSVCKNPSGFVVIGQYLFLLLIKENDSHLLKGYCFASYKRFQ